MCCQHSLNLRLPENRREAADGCGERVRGGLDSTLFTHDFLTVFCEWFWPSGLHRSQIQFKKDIGDVWQRGTTRFFWISVKLEVTRAATFAPQGLANRV